MFCKFNCSQTQDEAQDQDQDQDENQLVQLAHEFRKLLGNI